MNQSKKTTRLNTDLMKYNYSYSYEYLFLKFKIQKKRRCKGYGL